MRNINMLYIKEREDGQPFKAADGNDRVESEKRF